ncbi:MAG: type II toxin-antitoxin system VapC family toxin [Anaerolinea sp.]|nr:type II toxin-antitoxin system VapC family toxin [Anaerolinea sp.]
MGMIYLADTNIVSEIMRPQPDSFVYAYWQARNSEIAITSVTWHELLVGTLRLPASIRRTAFSSFLHEQVMSIIPILPYDQAAAAWHAQERARLMQIGRTPSFPDGQIAAIAATNNLILVTRNTADFANFANLRLENWFDPTA